MIIAAIGIAGGLVVLTVGWYLRVATTSGEAFGERIRVVYDSTCADEARPVLLARLDDYGIPGLPGEGLSFELTLPGRMPDERTHIPGVLARRGVLEVRVDDVLFPTKIQDVGVQLAFSGAPVTLLMVGDALPERGVTVTLDGEPVDVEEVTGQELQLAARAGQSDEAIRIATDRAVAIRHPLPCAVTVAKVEPIVGG